MLCAMRRLLGLAAVMATVLLFSGCFKVDMDLEVHSDETVSGTAIFGVQKEFAEELGGEDAFADGELPAGATSEDWSDDRFVGQKITFRDVALSEFNDTTSDDGGDALTITKNGDEFVLDGTFDMSQDESEGFDPTELMASAELEVTFTFPGKVKESNGDVSGRSVTWHPKAGDKNEMHAVAAASGSFGDTLSGLVLPVGVGLGFVVVIGGLLYATKRSAAGSTVVEPGEPGEAPSDSPSDAPGDAPEDAPGDAPLSGDAGDDD